jgi:hypothetical protein
MLSASHVCLLSDFINEHNVCNMYSGALKNYFIISRVSDIIVLQIFKCERKLPFNRPILSYPHFPLSSVLF